MLQNLEIAGDCSLVELHCSKGVDITSFRRDFEQDRDGCSRLYLELFFACGSLGAEVLAMILQTKPFATLGQ